MAQISKKRQIGLLANDEWEPKKRSTMLTAHAEFTPVPQSPVIKPISHSAVPFTPNIKFMGPNGSKGMHGVAGQKGPQRLIYHGNDSKMSDI